MTRREEIERLQGQAIRWTVVTMRDDAVRSLAAIALELDDEVERLTAACDDLKALADKWAVDSSKAEGKVMVMEAELERLRGALTQAEEQMVGGCVQCGFPLWKSAEANQTHPTQEGKPDPLFHPACERCGGTGQAPPTQPVVDKNPPIPDTT